MPRIQPLHCIALVAMAALSLLACDSGEGASSEDGAGGRTVEDLPEDALFLWEGGGAAPFSGEPSELLDRIDFEPLYPRAVPGDRRLARAAVMPSAFARDGSDPQATLELEYRGDGGERDWINVTQVMQPMPGISGAPTEPVEINGAEGLLLDLPNTEAIQLTWHDCEITVTLMSHIIDRDEMVAMGESMTEDCSAEGDEG